MTISRNTPSRATISIATFISMKFGRIKLCRATLTRMTFSTMTFSRKTLLRLTFRIIAFSTIFNIVFSMTCLTRIFLWKNLGVFRRHYDIHPNDTPHNGFICDTQHKWHSEECIWCPYTEGHHAECSNYLTVILCVIMLNVVVLSIVRLNVVAPFRAVRERYKVRVRFYIG